MCPLTPNQMQTLVQSFIRQCCKVAYISMDTFKTSRKFGGFKMTDLNSQIRYIKAKYLNNIFFEKETSQSTQIFRCKIQYAIHELMDYAYQEHYTEQRARLHRQGISSMDSLGNYSDAINDRIKTHYWWVPLIGKSLACPPHAGRNFGKISGIFNHRVFLEAERLIIKSYANLFELNTSHNPVARIQTLDADNKNSI